MGLVEREYKIKREKRRRVKRKLIKPQGVFVQSTNTINLNSLLLK